MGEMKETSRAGPKTMSEVRLSWRTWPFTRHMMRRSAAADSPVTAQGPAQEKVLGGPQVVDGLD